MNDIAYRHNLLVFNTATGQHRAFLEGGFYESSSSKSAIHEHNYTEIHLVTGGEARFTVLNKAITLKSGSMLVIPKKAFHSADGYDKTTIHCAFQTDCEAETARVYELSCGILNELFRLIESVGVTGDHSEISAYLALLCSKFERSGKLLPQKITDYGYLIFEFFSLNYNRPVRLEELADILHLSERQAERLVIEHTGRSFRDELAATRIRIARQLLKSNDMSLSEIAEYVGYRSYAGFWKAMKKYKE